MKNESNLTQKYPLLFPDHYRTGDSMFCLDFGFECGEGWYNLIDETLQKLNNLHDPTLSIAQIKEKYGTLRIYLFGYSEQAEQIVYEAELKSATICEVCGDAGSCDHSEGWISIRCPLCKDI